MSVFTDLAKGDHDYSQALVGVRYYFGKQKTLKKRHREDDPQNAVKTVLGNIGTYGSQYNSSAKAYNAKARAYNESLRNDPFMTPVLFEFQAMPIFDNSDSYGFTMICNSDYL